MRMKRWMMILGLTFLGLMACEKEEATFTEDKASNKEEPIESENTEQGIKAFIYKGMNEIYLYKAEVPELADDHFSKESELTGFLQGFQSPEALFEDLKASVDRFSFLTDDYFALEDRFNGISGSTGIKYGLGRISGTNNVFGFLQYILPGTSAEEAGLTRGTIFTKVDGQELTLSNYQKLLDADSFTINTGKIVDGKIQMSNTTVTLKNRHYTSDPVYINNILEIQGQKVGYLMYNSFIGDFDDRLNEGFAAFKAEGIQDLVLDLRYNGGGSVESAKDLASMITGQFKGKVFMKEQWNEKYQKHLETNNPESLINRFDDKIRTNETINSLGLSRLYVLTTNQTASASELIINGLEPYIEVIQVGESTTGKFQASVTLYDSPDFQQEKANKDHTYALQPLVFKSANAHGRSDYIDGLAPDITYAEDLEHMGELGDPSEPLLRAAVDHMLGKVPRTPGPSQLKNQQKFQKIGESGMKDPSFQRMYIEKLPEGLPLQ